MAAAEAKQAMNDAYCDCRPDACPCEATDPTLEPWPASDAAPVAVPDDAAYSEAADAARDVLAARLYVLCLLAALAALAVIALAG